jgi:hypothetical protein
MGTSSVHHGVLVARAQRFHRRPSESRIGIDKELQRHPRARPGVFEELRHGTNTGKDFLLPTILGKLRPRHRNLASDHHAQRIAGGNPLVEGLTADAKQIGRFCERQRASSPFEQRLAGALEGAITRILMAVALQGLYVGRCVLNLRSCLELLANEVKMFGEFLHRQGPVPPHERLQLRSRCCEVG